MYIKVIVSDPAIVKEALINNNEEKIIIEIIKLVVMVEKEIKILATSVIF